MKKLNVLLFFSCLSSFCYSQIDSIIVKSIDLPKTYWTIYYVDSIPKISNGILFSGIDTSVFFQGEEKLLAYETFKDGFKVEVTTFYENGNPERFFQFKNGKRNGISRGWYKSGKIMFDDKMQEGKNIGTSFLFYENGNIRSIIDDEKEFSLGFYENGKMKSLVKKIEDSTRCEGGKGMDETLWYENGQLMSKMIGNCGKQLYKEYYNDTIIGRERTIIDMPLFFVGKYSENYKNGKAKIIGYYKDGNTQSEANIKIGVWKYYNEKGKLIKEEYYENGELKKTNPPVKLKAPLSQ